MSQAGVDALIWTAVAMVAIVGTLLALAAYRRRMHRADAEAKRPVFTLAEIKRLRDTGEITIPEYEALRAKLIKESGL